MMHKSISSAQEQTIRERLQSEAAEIRPAYSEAFHQRLVSAVERQRREDAVQTRRVPGFLRDRLRRAAFLAAACALGAVLIARQSTERAEKPANNLVDQSVAVGQPGNKHQDPNQNTAQQAGSDVQNSKNAQVADLQKIRDLTVRAEDHFDGLLAAATQVPQSAELKHDTRLVAQMLLRRLPVDVDVFAGADELQDSKKTSF